MAQNEVFRLIVKAIRGVMLRRSQVAAEAMPLYANTAAQRFGSQPQAIKEIRSSQQIQH